jgi:hypothetical protein
MMTLRIAREGEPMVATPAPLRLIPYPRFLRPIPATDAEYELHCGLLRITAVKLYDTMVSVRWQRTMVVRRPGS